MTRLRIALMLVALSAAAYLAYLKTRPGVGVSATPQPNYQTSMVRDHLPPPAPAVHTVSSSATNTSEIEPSRDREKLNEQIIAKAMAAKLSDLAKGMPEETFGDWLKNNFAGKAKVSWEVNDCGENDGSGHQEELPVCAEADLNFPNGELIGISIAVASVQMKTEVHTFGPAGLFSSFFTSDNKKFCSPSLDRIGQWANGNLQGPPCTPER